MTYSFNYYHRRYVAWFSRYKAGYFSKIFEVRALFRNFYSHSYRLFVIVFLISKCWEKRFRYFSNFSFHRKVI